jgi:hypothetical protein
MEEQNKDKEQEVVQEQETQEENTEEISQKALWSALDLVWHDEETAKAIYEGRLETKESEEEKKTPVIHLEKDDISKLLATDDVVKKEDIIKKSSEKANLEKINNIKKEVEEETSSLIDRIDEDIKNDSARNVLDYNAGKPKFEDISASDREYTEEETKDEEKTNINVIIDPVTGEHKITGLDHESEDKEFNDLVDQINSSDDDYFEIKDLSEDDIKSYTNNPDKNGVLSDLASNNDGFAISPQGYTSIIDIIERRGKMENFNVYKSLPPEVKKLIDDYIKTTPATALPTKELNRFKNQLAESIISEFVMNIQINKSKQDFATDLEKIYATDNKNNKFESEEERFKAYNAEADKIEEADKKKRMKDILAKINEARQLDTLAEFAKTCKIKKIEVEKYQSRIFNTFLGKYKTSAKNIYDINIGLSVVTRHMLEYECTFEEAIKFMIVFCKFVQNYSPDNYLEHAYMYYVLYYCAMLDTEKSKTYTDNIFKVISAIREREGA